MRRGRYSTGLYRVACPRHSRSPQLLYGDCRLTALAELGVGVLCPAREQWTYPKADKQADNPRDLQGLPPSSIRHPGYHVGYDLAWVRGRKKPPCFCRCWLRWMAAGWLGVNDRPHLFKAPGSVIGSRVRTLRPGTAMSKNLTKPSRQFGTGDPRGM